MLWLSKLLNPTVISIIERRATIAKGRIRAGILREISALCADQNIQKGTITIDGTGRLGFTSSIPKAAHQRIRNIVASD